MTMNTGANQNSKRSSGGSCVGDGQVEVVVEKVVNRTQTNQVG